MRYILGENVVIVQDNILHLVLNPNDCICTLWTAIKIYKGFIDTQRV